MAVRVQPSFLLARLVDSGLLDESLRSGVWLSVGAAAYYALSLLWLMPLAVYRRYPALQVLMFVLPLMTHLALAVVLGRRMLEAGAGG
jgi:hypothetical protein